MSGIAWRRLSKVFSVKPISEFSVIFLSIRVKTDLQLIGIWFTWAQELLAERGW